MHRIRSHCVLRLTCGILLGCAQVGPAAAHCPGAPDPGDGWTTAAPAQEGLDPAVLCSIRARLAGLLGANPNAVVLVRHGVLVYETYFHANDARWPQQRWGQAPVDMPHDARTKHDLQGITADVVALLTGIALDRGALGSIDIPVFRLFPQYGDLGAPNKSRITLRDILTMTSGLDWPQRPFLGMLQRLDAAPDPYRFVLAQPLTNMPGVQFRYNPGGEELAGAILQDVTGQPLDSFAKHALFDPLGITDWEWGRLANGNPAASWGLRLRPRDLAKIGQLVLNNGTWHAQQIVSAAWVKAMIAPQVSASIGAYGYLWMIVWSQIGSVDGSRIDIVEAKGWGGQRLYLVPSLDMVIVVTAGDYDFTGEDFEAAAADTARNIALHAALPAGSSWVSMPAPGHAVIVTREPRRP